MGVPTCDLVDWECEMGIYVRMVSLDGGQRDGQVMRCGVVLGLMIPEGKIADDETGY